MIVIVDYGMGNLRSVQKGFERAGFEALVSSKPQDVERAARVVLPGVGAFGDAMNELQRRGLVEPIGRSIKDNKPFLGLCLGMQILFTRSYEGGEFGGLDLLKGEVKRFSGDLKVPHMGWNQIKKSQESRVKNREQIKECPLLKSIEDDAYVYFVHSYYVEPEDKSIVAAWTDYGGKFASVICKDNVFATQFHPEKSQQVGLKILENFAKV